MTEHPYLSSTRLVWPGLIQPFIRTTRLSPDGAPATGLKSVGASLTSGPFGQIHEQRIADTWYSMGLAEYTIDRPVTFNRISDYPQVGLLLVIKGNVVFSSDVEAIAFEERRYALRYLPAGTSYQVHMKKGNFQMMDITLSMGLFAAVINQNAITAGLYEHYAKRSSIWRHTAQCTIRHREMELINDMINTFSNDASGKLLLMARICDLLLAYFAGLAAMATPASRYAISKEERVRNTGNFIKENCGQRLSLTELARRAAMNQTTFEKIFKQVFHVSPQVYLQECRVQKAGDLLRRTNDPITEIAISSGFSDVYYFSRVFKKHVGSPPHKYRLKMKAIPDKQL